MSRIKFQIIVGVFLLFLLWYTGKVDLFERSILNAWFVVVIGFIVLLAGWWHDDYIGNKNK
jgi:hypothetical protein